METMFISIMSQCLRGLTSAGCVTLKSGNGKRRGGLFTSAKTSIAGLKLSGLSDLRSKEKKGDTAVWLSRKGNREW